MSSVASQYFSDDIGGDNEYDFVCVCVYKISYNKMCQHLENLCN